MGLAFLTKDGACPLLMLYTLLVGHMSTMFPLCAGNQGWNNRCEQGPLPFCAASYVETGQGGQHSVRQLLPGTAICNKLSAWRCGCKRLVLCVMHNLRH